ncbi:MAG: cupin domain-containing protein [Desulfobacteraceae bacterium]|nr:cupin domain-containing protein [Desulfobacteraceae bacterium]
MNSNTNSRRKSRVSSGVSQLDKLLGSLYIGDNVVWHDDSGSLASIFCLNFIQSSLAQKKPLIYMNFDRSPRNLLEKLGAFSASPALTIIDCFSGGKGSNSPIFLRFYDDVKDLGCQILRVKDPRKIEEVMDVLYDQVHANEPEDVRLVFESLTGMQELWGGEDKIIQFYAHSCPRLYELNTLAYWILEKKAHSPRLRAQINQIAQVVVELSIKRGTSSLTIIKSEKRDLGNINKPMSYWTRDMTVTFDEERKGTGGIDLGFRLKELRSRRGFSQTDLAKLVGVTPSTISQIESNLIYPSLPALLKMTEVLMVDISSFFQDKPGAKRRIVFPESEGTDIRIQGFDEGSLRARRLAPIDLDLRAEPYLLEILPEKSLSSHFFVHKGEEVGYMLSGELQLKVDTETYTVREGDLLYLSSDIPNQWRNTGSIPARLLWLKIRN